MYGDAADRPDLTAPGASTPWWQDPNARPDWWPADQPWPPPMPAGATGHGQQPGEFTYNPASPTTPHVGGPNDQHGNPVVPAPAAGPSGPSAGGSLAGGLGANQFFGAPPSMINLGGPPGLTYLPPPPNFDSSKPQWTPPTAADALSDPGYKFRVDQGNNGLQQWAGAKGTLNDSSTAKSLEDYNQNAASQEYQQVWNRNHDAYLGNVNAWNIGTVQPGTTAYTTTAAAAQHQNDLNYLDFWNKGVFNTDFAKWWATQ